MPQNILNVNFDFTYNGKLSLEILNKPSVVTPPISQFWEIMPGIGYKIQLPTLDPLSKIIKQSSNCARVFTNSNEIQNITLETRELQLNHHWCKELFENAVIGNHLAEAWLRPGIESFDPSGTPINQIILDMLMDALRRDLFRIISFGDTADADADWNQLDGFWTQILALAGDGSSYCVQKPVTFGLGALATDEALDAFRIMYQAAPSILDQMATSEKYINVTRSLYDNLLTSYESNTTGSELQFTNLTNGQGQETLKFRGIDVNKITSWDDFLADPTAPLFGIQEHLAVYTTRKNHIVGVHRESDMSRIEGFFDRTEREYIFEGDMKMGYVQKHCDLTVIGTSV